MSISKEEFFSMLLKRESCRDYDNTKQVSKEDLDSLLKAGCLAPSACNSQPWKFVAAQGETAKAVQPLLCRGSINSWTVGVGTFIVICEIKAKLREGVDVESQHFAQLDLGIATGFLSLAATSMGLSTCIMGCFKEPELKKLLNIPEEAKIRLVMAVGYAKTSNTRKKIRKEFDSSVGHNKF